MAPTAADVVIVTALEEEREAVLRYLPRHRRQAPTSGDIQVYYTANLSVQFSNNTPGKYRVVVLSLINMGRVQAATATNDAIRRWQPRYVLLVGIAGGVAASGVSVGDVIIADQVADYELQKVSVRGSSIRWDVHKADARLLAAARNMKAASWVNTIKVKRPSTGTPKRHIGPIASGDKVIAATEVLNQLRTTWPKIVGVEMEAGGAATATFNSNSKPGFFMVRGVSDLADENKGAAKVEQWRTYACDVAAAYAIALLRSGPFLLQSPTATPRNRSAGHTVDTSSTRSNPSRVGGRKSANNVPLPPVHSEPTQRDKDVFLTQALKTFERYFKKALGALKKERPETDIDLTVISPRKFTATIYVRGEARNRCKIWLGDAFHSESVCYAEGRHINIDQDNSMNAWFSVENVAGQLYLKTYDHGMWTGAQPGGRYTPQQAAEYLWLRFIQPLMR